MRGREIGTCHNTGIPRENSNKMNCPTIKKKGVSRMQNMRFYPFVFTGKEKDEETGYGYFGARYMDHELMTMWLSVDPMADKYPSISPYSYCAWNPVKLVDPDGNDWYEYTDEKTKQTEIRWTECSSQKKMRDNHIDGRYLGITVTDGDTYYGLMGDIVNKTTEEGKLTMALDRAIINWSLAKSISSTEYVEFSVVFNHNRGWYSNNSRDGYTYARKGKVAIAMNGTDMMGRFDGKVQMSENGNDNQGMAGAMSLIAQKCPRYNIRGNLADGAPIAGISFYKQPNALKGFERMLNRLVRGNNLIHATKNGQDWVQTIY